MSGHLSAHAFVKPCVVRAPTRRCHGPAPTNVTNQGKEMRVAKLLEEAGLADDDYIVIDPDEYGPDPHLGPLSRRVSTTFEEGLTQEEVDPEAEKYWFTIPEGGWDQEKKKLRKPQVVVTDDIDVLRHDTDTPEGAGRTPLSALQVGDILQGVVVKQMLFHGFQVDVGAEADALIWCSQLNAWTALPKDAIPEIGDPIEIEVVAIRQDPIFRFPLQAMPTDSRLAAALPAPELHEPPLDLREVKLSEMPDIARRSGREWKSVKVVVPTADEEEGVLGEGGASAGVGLGPSDDNIEAMHDLLDALL